MMMHPFDLNLRHLRALIAIREQGSISGAAEIVSLSQPALTQGLAKLEAQFACTLFERRSDGMVPTRFGQLVTDRAEAALAHLAGGTKGFNRVFSLPENVITMTQVRAFLALADAGSFVSAAGTMGLSQTAVHRGVRELESVLGAEMVERRGRGVWINAGGKRFARGARLAVAELAAAIADTQDESEGESIAIGALPLSRPFLVPAAMGRLAAERPRARFEIFEGSWREMVEPLRDGAVDMVVGTLRSHEVADLRQVPIYDDQLVIAAGAEHPLAGAQKPDLDALRRYPWIVPPKNSPLRQEWERLFAGSQKPNGPIETGSVMIIGRLLTEGEFLTLLSPSQIALQIGAGLLAQVGPPLSQSTRRLGIIVRQDWRPTRLQRRFMELLVDLGESPDSHENHPIASRGWI
ncbi:MAG: LysR family transcriptional regulator [Maritimibacter sp.]